MSGDGKGILLLWRNPKERRSLFKILCATGTEVRFGDTDDVRANELSQCKLIVVDYDSLGEKAEQLLKEVEGWTLRPSVLLVSSFEEREQLLQLLEMSFLTNFLGKNQEVGANDLFITVQKLLKNEIFGLDKYLTWGVASCQYTLTGSGEKDDAIAALEDYLSSIGCNRRLAGLAATVADELLMNAIYNAPVHPDGSPKYASQARTEPVELSESERVQFCYACDGRTLALSVEDNFGRLRRDTVLSYVRKGLLRGEDQIDQKEGGAGLGLYYIYESMNHLIVNVAPERRTEIIGLLDISGSYRDYARHPKSLNLFVEEQ